MKKAQKAETAPEEKLEENLVVETQESSVDGDIGGGGIQNPPKIEGEEENSIVAPEIPEETTTINDGADGDAGQDSVNDIDVEFKEVSKEEDIYVNAYIKISNALTDLKDARENDISIEKNEDLDVAILYAEKAIESIEKLRK